MKNSIWVLPIFFFISNLCANILLERPKPLSRDEVEHLAQNWNTEFTWDWKKASSTFIYENGKAGFAFKLLNIPIYFHRYRLFPTVDEIKQMLSYESYYFAEPLRAETPPKNISPNKLIVFLNKHKFVLYTGAGISASGNVATMTDLEESLEMNKGKRHFLKSIWQNPQKITKAFSKFCQSAIYGNPTKAHFALKEIAEKKSISILTENVDLLQQRTGIEPIHSYSKKLHSISKKSLQEIDAIVCVGLSHDDRGLLTRYKQNNPKGILIAINLETPNYLSENDYVYLGDLQKVLPFIAEHIK